MLSYTNDVFFFFSFHLVIFPLDFRDILTNTKNLLGSVYLRTTRGRSTSKYQTRDSRIEELKEKCLAWHIVLHTHITVLWHHIWPPKPNSKPHVVLKRREKENERETTVQNVQHCR